MFKAEQERSAQLSEEIDEIDILQWELYEEHTLIMDSIERNKSVDDAVAMRVEEICEQMAELRRKRDKLVVERENIRIYIAAMQVGHLAVDDLAWSSNYELSGNFMPHLFLNSDIKIEALYGQKGLTEIFYMTVLRSMIKSIGAPRSYMNIPIYYIKNKEGKGIVLQIPEPKNECECNYVALVEVENGEKKYYTSEFFSEYQSFRLCEITKDRHILHGQSTNTLQNFVQAIGFDLDDPSKEKPVKKKTVMSRIRDGFLKLFTLKRRRKK